MWRTNGSIETLDDFLKKQPPLTVDEKEAIENEANSLEFDESSISWLKSSDGWVATDAFGNTREPTLLEKMKFWFADTIPTEPKLKDETIELFPAVAKEAAPLQTAIHNTKTINKNLLFAAAAAAVILVAKK